MVFNDIIKLNLFTCMDYLRTLRVLFSFEINGLYNMIPVDIDVLLVNVLRWIVDSCAIIGFVSTQFFTPVPREWTLWVNILTRYLLCWGYFRVKYTFPFFIISWQWDGAGIWFFIHFEDKNLFILYIPYNDSQWPVQIISSHDIDLAIPEYPSLRTRRVTYRWNNLHRSRKNWIWRFRQVPCDFTKNLFNVYIAYITWHHDFL